MSGPLLDVQDLSTRFRTGRGEVLAVDGVSLQLAAGETLGIVGESGSGKSVLVRSVMGLIDGTPNAEVTGAVRFGDHDLRAASDAERRALWGTEIGVVFQDPKASLNPVKRIRRHFAEHLRQHQGLRRQAATERAADLLAQVGIAEPRRTLDRYPHELSGGQCQRVCIALALAGEPRLLIADEPTTALDVTVQQQILELLDEIRSTTGMATLFITHDLALVNRHCERVMVMYAGRVVERSDVRTLHRSSQHPYTRALLAAAPRLDTPLHARLATIEGRPPDLSLRIVGCSFAPRCAAVVDQCRAEVPELRRLGSEQPHEVACHRVVDDGPVRREVPA